MPGMVVATPFAASAEGKEQAGHTGYSGVGGLPGRGFAVLAWEVELTCSASYVVLSGLAGQVNSLNLCRTRLTPCWGGGRVKLSHLAMCLTLVWPRLPWEAAGWQVCLQLGHSASLSRGLAFL